MEIISVLFDPVLPVAAIAVLGYLLGRQGALGVEAVVFRIGYLLARRDHGLQPCATLRRANRNPVANHHLDVTFQFSNPCLTALNLQGWWNEKNTLDRKPFVICMRG